MAKFNVIQKHRRAQKAILNRSIHGDPKTGKIKFKPQPLAISGKRKRKLFNKARREQNECMRKGLLALGDMEMALAEGTSKEASKSRQELTKCKKTIRGARRKNRSSKALTVSASSVDAMIE